MYTYIYTARALYKNVGCRWPGPSIFYRKGPMYVSIYVQLFGRGSLNFLAIS